MSLGALLIVALVGPLLSWRLSLAGGRHGGSIATLLPAGLFLGFLMHWSEVTAGVVVVETASWVPSLRVALDLKLDGFSMLFALLITGVGTLVTVYAASYFATAPARTRARFIMLIHLFMAAMLGTVLADNLIVMYLFWEWTSLTSFMLIGFESTKPAARRAASQSLIVTAGGGLALFAGILLVGMELGTFSLTEVVARSEDLLQSPYLAAMVALVLVGAFTKSAQFPFHFWLPQAMAAPTPASAYLHSATMVKLGIYLLARFASVFEQVPAFGTALLTVGTLTMLVAAVGAVRAKRFKAVLAQSTVASLAMLVMLIGLGSAEAAVAVSVFILAHALYKAALFFAAGNVIQCTGRSELDEVGGLARFLPWTALASVLAGVSLAGLPPALGFIAKEYMFEAQLGTVGPGLVMWATVLVGAVMVGVAYVVALRPWFLRIAKTTSLRHGERPGQVVAPLLLAATGLVLAVFPGLAMRPLVNAAAGALAGIPTAASMTLWHGLTPMLALSAAAVVLGVILALGWTRLRQILDSAPFARSLDADRIYHRMLGGLLALARITTRVLQNGDQRKYTLVVAIGIVAVSAWALVRRGGFEFAAEGAVLAVPTGLLLLALAGSLVTVLSRSLVTALLGVGVVGYGSALLFLLNGAPDLALTQFAVETLVLVVVMAVLGRLPVGPRPTRSSAERRTDALVAVAFAVIAFVGLAGMLSGPFDTRLSAYFGEAALAEAHGRNVVNVILVDFRALDTLGEIAVVGFATMAAWVLLRNRRRKGKG